MLPSADAKKQRHGGDVFCRYPDEMLYGGFMYRWFEETTEKPIHNRGVSELRRLCCFMDQDMDRFVTPDEMTKRLRESWDSGRLKEADINGDGRLTVLEYGNFRRNRSSSR